MGKKIDPNEVWCRGASQEEHDAFWKNWCETQWGMPTFDLMRRWIEMYRLRVSAAA